jgi:pimeloyl-ACP methyl ester carboxylesterase
MATARVRKKPGARKHPKKAAKESGLESGWDHYPQSDLRWAGDQGWMPKSQVLLSRHRPLSGIIFVHGWGGSSGSTWEEFPEALGTMPETAKSDAFLIEYPTLTETVAFCASQFRRFVFDVIRDPVERVVNPSLPLSAPTRDPMDRYERVLIVAHSMGAVVARRALLDSGERATPAARLTDDEFQKIRMLFFAPAHRGSQIPLLIGSGLGLDNLPGAKMVGAILKVWMRSLRDLEEESPALKKLAADALEEVRRRESRNAPTDDLRAKVYHARGDKVVVQEDFDLDYPFEPVMERNHRTICKPFRAYRTPIEALSAMLLDGKR